MTEEQAITIARRVAEEEGWAWADPALAVLRRKWTATGGRWEILSNAHGLGAKVRVIVDDESGVVLEKGYVPR